MKPGTFTQIYVQLVFAVQNREAVLTQDTRIRVFEYMSEILTNIKPCPYSSRIKSFDFSLRYGTRY
jgi:hypothetical protein